MKILSPFFLKKVSSKEINQLTKQVKETLDIEMKNTRQKVFTEIDLWNIYKQKRNFPSRKLV